MVGDMEGRRNTRISHVHMYGKWCNEKISYEFTNWSITWIVGMKITEVLCELSLHRKEHIVIFVIPIWFFDMNTSYACKSKINFFCTIKTSYSMIKLLNLLSYYLSFTSYLFFAHCFSKSRKLYLMTLFSLINLIVSHPDPDFFLATAAALITYVLCFFIYIYEIKYIWKLTEHPRTQFSKYMIVLFCRVRNLLTPAHSNSFDIGLGA